MEILYFGTVCGTDFEKEILTRTRIPSVTAQNSLERSLLNGFMSNGIGHITGNCIPCIPYEVLGKKLFFKSRVSQVNSDISSKSYFVLKLPVLKYLIYMFATIDRKSVV